MSKAERKSTLPAEPAHGYEFFGPPGTFLVSIGLPLVTYAAAFICNDVTGCPAPSLLNPSTLTLEKLKRDVVWPGFSGLYDTKVFGWTLAYYFLSLLLQAVLPGVSSEGTVLENGGRLKYKFNAFTSAIFTLSIAAGGTALQGASFPLWTFVWANYIQLITSNLIIAFVLAVFVYVRSFEVKKGDKKLRLLAKGGHSGNVIYDWFIGRELNPRVTLPLLGEIDIKAFMELRPGLQGWVILDLAFAARQFQTYGYLTDSMILIITFQALYVFDGLWMEPAILTTMDITTDGFGFMLSFGDLVWLPFIYSLQARYLAVYPVNLGVTGIAGVLAVQGLGYYIFRASNNEKNRFRTDPNDPRVAHLKYIETKSGSRLLTSGWWGTARHINYLGDWIMAWSYCLPTGVAGYVVERSRPAVVMGAAASGEELRVVQGDARGWGMIFTYFYVVYFAVLLTHRELRDEEKCRRKYGKDWDRYTRKVRWRILPGVY